MHSHTRQQLKFQAVLAGRAQFMRHNGTDTEQILWRCLFDAPSGLQLSDGRGCALCPAGIRRFATTVVLRGKLQLAVPFHSGSLRSAPVGPRQIRARHRQRRWTARGWGIHHRVVLGLRVEAMLLGHN
jgi:hypothetical protein